MHLNASRLLYIKNDFHLNERYDAIEHKKDFGSLDGSMARKPKLDTCHRIVVKPYCAIFQLSSVLGTLVAVVLRLAGHRDEALTVSGLNRSLRDVVRVAIESVTVPSTLQTKIRLLTCLQRSERKSRVEPQLMSSSKNIETSNLRPRCSIHLSYSTSNIHLRNAGSDFGRMDDILANKRIE